MKRPTSHDVQTALRSPWRREVNVGDRVFRLVTATFALLVLLVLAGMAIEMTRASALSIKTFGIGFLVSTEWDPVREQYGALPFLFGTVVSSLVALVIAVPIALAVAIYLAELAPAPIRKLLGFVVELLAAIPSVIYGLWGIFVLAPWLRETVQPGLKSAFGFLPFFQGTTNGLGMLTAGLILAIMILPTIASISRDVLRAAPSTLREGALALGATRWEAIRHTVLPFVRSGVVGAIMLGLGRALGETMAVTMVIGNRAEISASLFNQSATMASVIANEYTEASNDLHLSALSELALLLFVVTLLLNGAARLLVWRAKRGLA
jgi:phosphate transport system permease protein